MFTFQDFTTAVSSEGYALAVQKAIQKHKTTDLYRWALKADKYDKQLNETIMSFQKFLYLADGTPVADYTAANNKLCSNFFSRLNTQRTTYSLGNGVTFAKKQIKKKLGIKFDTRIKEAGYLSLIHGVSFLFWNVDKLHVFPVTEYAPLWDEESGAMKAGVRFWQVDKEKPVYAVLYEEDGYTKLKGNRNATGFEIIEDKRAYRVTTRKAPADIEAEVIGEENYGSLPIIPLWGSRIKQSTLVGLQGKIDAYDLISSGLADDLLECSEIYWIVNNAGGMDDADLARFRDRLKLQHIAAVDNADDASVTAQTQDIPTTARKETLTQIRNDIYEDFGALDVHVVSAGSTNDHIEAAYQPMDENADDFEYQLIEAIQGILALINIEDTPTFKRNRISNQKELTEMILLVAEYLDDETILNKLPFITPDEVEAIINKKIEEDTRRLLNREKEYPDELTADDEEEDTEEDNE